MSPARRRKTRKRKSKKKGERKVIYKILFWILVLLAIFLVFRLTTKYWNNVSKLTLVSPQENGDIQVSTFDPKADSIRVVVIPKDTQIRVARQLGTWRIKSVWELGENEGLNGQLLSESVTKQFKIPVYVWGDVKVSGFSSSKAAKVIKSTILPYKTNLGIGDRVRLGMFSLGVKNFKRETTDLSDTKVLERTVLVDGSAGYKVVGDLPSSIVAIYSDPYLSSVSAKTQIVDATSDAVVAKEVGEIVEVVGLKVTSIENVEVNNELDCIVSGKDKELTKTISQLFSCDIKNREEDNFDLIIQMGEEFVKRF